MRGQYTLPYRTTANFEWMDTVGDPGFVYHKTMAQVWAQLILELADRELLPFDLIVYEVR